MFEWSAGCLAPFSDRRLRERNKDDRQRCQANQESKSGGRKESRLITMTMSTSPTYMKEGRKERKKGKKASEKIQRGARANVLLRGGKRGKQRETDIGEAEEEGNRFTSASSSPFSCSCSSSSTLTTFYHTEDRVQWTSLIPRSPCVLEDVSETNWKCETNKHKSKKEVRRRTTKQRKQRSSIGFVRFVLLPLGAFSRFFSIQRPGSSIPSFSSSPQIGE